MDGREIKNKILQKFYSPYKGKIKISEVFDELNELEKKLEEKSKKSN